MLMPIFFLFSLVFWGSSTAAAERSVSSSAADGKQALQQVAGIFAALSHTDETETLQEVTEMFAALSHTDEAQALQQVGEMFQKKVSQQKKKDVSFTSDIEDSFLLHYEKIYKTQIHKHLSDILDILQTQKIFLKILRTKTVPFDVKPRISAFTKKYFHSPIRYELEKSGLSFELSIIDSSLHISRSIEQLKGSHYKNNPDLYQAIIEASVLEACFVVLTGATELTEQELPEYQEFKQEYFRQAYKGHSEIKKIHDDFQNFIQRSQGRSDQLGRKSILFKSNVSDFYSSYDWILSLLEETLVKRRIEIVEKYLFRYQKEAIEKLEEEIAKEIEEKFSVKAPFYHIAEMLETPKTPVLATASDEKEDVIFAENEDQNSHVEIFLDLDETPFIPVDHEWKITVKEEKRRVYISANRVAHGEKERFECTLLLPKIKSDRVPEEFRNLPVEKCLRTYGDWKKSDPRHQFPLFMDQLILRYGMLEIKEKRRVYNQQESGFSYSVITSVVTQMNWYKEDASATILSFDHESSADFKEKIEYVFSGNLLEKRAATQLYHRFLRP